MPDRWIFNFGRIGRRELADAEREDLRKRARKLGGIAFARASLALALGLTSFLGMMLAASGAIYGWQLFGAALVAMFWVISWASSAGYRRLLFARASRLGVVDQYERRPEAAEARRRYRATRTADDDESQVPPEFWAADEKFEERIRKIAGAEARILETPANDEVVLSVDGKLVDRPLNVPVLEAPPERSC